MGNRIFQAVVVLLWLSAMSWLMVAKILPPFFQGEPPRVGARSHDTPVGWRIELQGKPCGIAVSQSLAGTADTTEVHSRVRLNSIPLPEDAPQWLLGLLSNLGDVELDLRNRATFDSLGSLASFQTRVRVNDVAQIVKMTGNVRDGVLQLKMQTGEYIRRSEHPWRKKSMIGGQLSPEPKLLNMYVGRRWREEVYSPFSRPGQPAELVEAEVEEEERLLHRGELIRVKRIVYRSLSAAGVSEKDRLRSVLWVEEDGRVLRQDSFFMNVCLRFTRVPEQESASLADEWLDLDVYSSVATPKRQQPAGDDPPAKSPPTRRAIEASEEPTAKQEAPDAVHD